MGDRRKLTLADVSVHEILHAFVQTARDQVDKMVLMIKLFIDNR